MVNLREYFKSDRSLGGHWVDVSTNYYTGYALVFPKESKERGIDGGQIVKLWVRKRGTVTMVINYDRGWKMAPQDKYSKKFLDTIVKKYN